MRRILVGGQRAIDSHRCVIHAGALDDKGVGILIAVTIGQAYHGRHHAAHTGRIGDGEGCIAGSADGGRWGGAEAKGGIPAEGGGNTGQRHTTAVMDSKGAHHRPTGAIDSTKVGVIGAAGGGVATGNGDPIAAQVDFGRRRTKLLDVRHVAIRSVKIVVLIRCHPNGALGSPSGQIDAVGGKLLYATIAKIGHIEIAVTIGCDVERACKLTGGATGGSPPAEVGAVAVKFLNPVIALFKGIDVAAAIDCNAKESIKLTGGAAE